MQSFLLSKGEHYVTSSLVVTTSVVQCQGMRLVCNRSGIASHYHLLMPVSDLKHDTPVATLPDAWHYRVSDRTGWPSVSIL